MAYTGDLVVIITQHVFETLYTFDKNWAVTPLLAAAPPEISETGTVLTISLRAGVTFHNGAPMQAADVLASLHRWSSISSPGRQTASQIMTLSAPDVSTIGITLKQPYAPLSVLLNLQQLARDHHAG